MKQQLGVIVTAITGLVGGTGAQAQGLMSVKGFADVAQDVLQSVNPLKISAGEGWYRRQAREKR